MSIRIELHIPDDSVNAATVASHMAALGYHIPDARTYVSALSTTREQLEEVFNKIIPAEPAAEMQTATEARQAETTPAPRKRRTKAEIEAEKAVQTMEQAAQAEEKVMSAAQAEAHFNPGQADTPETAAQDAADEKAESDAAGETLTLDTVRDLAGKYVAKFGMAAAQKDGVAIFTAALGPVPAGMKDSAGKDVEAWRMSVLPTDEDSLRRIVHAWEEAIETNPFDRATVG